jgi:tetraacyldisaccharide 4'-kinase
MIKGLVSKAYGAIVQARNKMYDNKEDELIKCKVPVISIGNLSVGGTGKTPFVQMLGKYLGKNRVDYAIVGRGYKRKSKGEIVISDGKNVLVKAEEGGDEMVLLADSLNVPVIAHDSKTEAAISIEKRFQPDLILVDDGFQHRNLYRDIDIVLIDRDTVENPYVMPKGRLREPLENISRADIICLTGGAQLTNEFREHIKPETLIITVEPFQGMPYDLITKRMCKDERMDEMKKGMMAVAGIAKPERFRDMLKAYKYNIPDYIDFPDHNNYDDSDLKKILKKCQDNNIRIIAVTEKDAAKLREFKDFFKENNIFCCVFPITLKINHGADHFFKTIRAVLKT